MSNGNVKSLSHGLPAAAQQLLRASAYASVLRDVQCEEKGGAVILRGRVSSFYFKQLAQEAVRTVDGARAIVNELEVEERTQSATNGQAHGESDVRSTERRGSAEATHGRADTDRG